MFLLRHTDPRLCCKYVESVACNLKKLRFCNPPLDIEFPFPSLPFPPGSMSCLQTPRRGGWADEENPGGSFEFPRKRTEKEANILRCHDCDEFHTPANIFWDLIASRLAVYSHTNERLHM